jgi:hypothetical protein
MSGLRHDHQLVVWNVPGEQPHDRRRRPQVGVTDEQQGGHAHLLEPRPGDLVDRLLADLVAGNCLVLEREPLPHAFRLGGTI